MVLIRPLRDGLSIRGGNKMNPYMLNLVSLHFCRPLVTGYAGSDLSYSDALNPLRFHR